MVPIAIVTEYLTIFIFVLATTHFCIDRQLSQEREKSFVQETHDKKYVMGNP